MAFYFHEQTATDGSNKTHTKICENIAQNQEKLIVVSIEMCGIMSVNNKLCNGTVC